MVVEVCAVPFFGYNRAEFCIFRYILGGVLGLGARKKVYLGINISII